jgi:CRP-like cAMP-binding protein
MLLCHMTYGVSYILYLILSQGDIGDIFYVISRGTVNVTKTDDNGNENVLITLSEGEVFGEQVGI